MDKPSFNVLALCAGGGGLELGLHKAVRNARVVCLVEIEAYACEVLASRMEEGRLDDAPIFTDLRAFDGRPWRGVVDCISGGYPCQPFSAAGKRKGESDPRHLWPEFARLVREIEPGWCFFENVAGHVSLGLRRVKSELEAMGYRVEAGLFTAAEVGASHRRERVFILAHRESVGSGRARRGEQDAGNGRQDSRTGSEGMADAASPERRGADSREREIGRTATGWAGSGVANPERMRCGDAEASRRDGAGEPIGRAGEGVGDAERARRTQAGSGRAFDAGSEPPKGRGGVADADLAGSQGRGGPVGGGGGECAAGTGGAEVADTADTGRRREDAGVGEISGEPAAGSSRGLPRFPPGPADADAWARILAVRPDLAPALTSAEEEAFARLRGVAHGVAGRVECRADRLRLLGNGVVPDEACEAFIYLHRSMTK